ncbi:type VI secretion protein [Streptomyces sp. NPDC006365]|uniref:type IV secretory system conjugative DNA transfer family protein n=1 Tax=Streptomyces sp. NPDC006365 TaxID=3364744 RepID=UPI0036D0A379
MALLVWSATGLAGLFDHGSWPSKVTFARTPLAMRHLIQHPHDVTGAWPETPESQLSGYGLFWGLLIGQLMVLVVLTVFVMGTVARWRAGRARRRKAAAYGAGGLTGAAGSGAVPGDSGLPAGGEYGSGVLPEGAAGSDRRHGVGTGAAPDAGTGSGFPAGGATTPGFPPTAGMEVPSAGATGSGHPSSAGSGSGFPADGSAGSGLPHAAGSGSVRPPGGATGAGIPHAGGSGHSSASGSGFPAGDADDSGLRPTADSGSGRPPAAGSDPDLRPLGAYASTPPTAPLFPAGPVAETPSGTTASYAADSSRAGAWEKPPVPAPRTPLILGPPQTRHPLATEAVRDAEGPALVITSSPALWSATKDARAKLGPVLLYDPSHLCDTPARLHWSPSSGCQDKDTARARAAALLAPVRPTAKMDQAVADVAETLLRSYLHAAATDGRAIRHLHRWAQGTGVQEAVRILRTNPKAAAGSAGELEAALTSYPERRDIAQELTARALSSLVTVNVREACTPNRTDALTLDSFVNEGGTLYVVGEPIEDPKAKPGAMPLLTALASSVVERGRRMAERSSSGRLDPPLTLVLDDVAAVAPLPQLPDLLATGPDRGMPTLALIRSREQARTRWPNQELPA